MNTERMDGAGWVARLNTDSRRRGMITALALGLIAAVGFAVYAPSLGGPFLWDDVNLIRDNTHLTQPGELGRLLTQPIGSGSGMPYTFYRPVQMLAYRLDILLGGLNPRGFHVSSVLTHVRVAWALFGLVHTLGGDRRTALFAALLFVVHPLHTEAVAYIAGRADPLAALFLLAALILAIRTRPPSVDPPRAAVLGLYALAILSKESSLIFPAVLLVHAAAFRRRPDARLFAGLLLMSAAYVALRLTVLRAWIVYEPAQGTAAQRLPGFLAALAAYARLLVVPQNLHMEYGFRLFDGSHPSVWIGGCLLAGAIGWLAVRRQGRAVFAVAWFLVTLLPVSNVYLINAFMAEHWLYLPSIGFCLWLADAPRVLARTPRGRAAAGVVLSAWLVWLAAGTIRQSGIWSDPVRLYEHTLRLAPESHTARINLALALQDQGRNDEARAQMVQALTRRADDAQTQLAAGVFYLRGGELTAAEAALKRALALQPGLGVAHYNLAILSGMRGEGARARGHAAEAERLGCPVGESLSRRLSALGEPAATTAE